MGFWNLRNSTAAIVFRNATQRRNGRTKAASSPGLGSSTITLTVSDGALTASDTFLLTVTGTAQQTWRFPHFGTTANTGTAADLADANNDGEANLLEFATGQIPYANTRVNTTLTPNGTNLEFTYTRANAALADGITFTVEWSDTLAAGSWSTTGVTQQILTDNGTVQTVKAFFPAGADRRFARLKVTTTP